MRRYDDLVGIGPRQHGVKEGLGVTEAILRYDSVICHKAIAPVLGKSQLAAALSKKQSCGRNLAKEHIDFKSNAIFLDTFHGKVVARLLVTWGVPSSSNKTYSTKVFSSLGPGLGLNLSISSSRGVLY